MSLQLVLALVLALCLPFSSSAEDREQRDLQAKEAFTNLNFFADGRGMMLSPNLISAYNLVVPGLGPINRQQFAARWGIVYNDEQKISGLQEVVYRKHHIGVMGCVVCHSGRAAGQFVVGLGNKNIDVLQLGRDVHRIEKYWQFVVPFVFKDENYKDMENASLTFSKYLANEPLGNLTQGLVPISFIRGWFYRIHNLEIPHDMKKSQVKVPALWGYGEKRKVGQFCDGFGDGDEVGWAIAVELAAGQRPETVRKYYSKVKAAEQELEHLLPPKYPFRVHAQLAETGRQHFNQTCARCHGTYEYDEQNLPLYKSPLWIPIEVVRTDSDRVDGHSSAFNQLVNTSPLNDILRWKNDRHGYFAPRLVGIWARFPYLHNGSVPSLADLLTPEAERPGIFSLREAGERHRFDSARVGLTLPQNPRQLAKQRRRDVYDVTRIGHSNRGHDFFTSESSTFKQAILEYLKTL